jgi:hypothetical protein
MPWSHRLKPPLALKNGRRLVTLKDAAEVLLDLPEIQQQWPVWVYVAELLRQAAEGQQAAFDAVDLLVYIALQQSRMLKKR